APDARDLSAGTVPGARDASSGAAPEPRMKAPGHAGARVVVVGAGIAGLAAAWHLRRAGVPVGVLEADGRVGGRMTTHRRDGFGIERGTQVVSSSYATSAALQAEVGLAHRLRPLSPCGAIVRDGRPRKLHSSSPLRVVLSG